MNEHIEGLWWKARIGYNNQSCDPEVVAKFAELIVAECSKVIRHGGQRKGAFGNEDLRPSEIATMIEEHFGVKE
jgi:hypothetical protein